MEKMIDVLTTQWQWMLLLFMVCEKIVKISPSKADDILLDVVIDGLKKLVGLKKK